MALQEFCGATRMEVNVAKTDMLVFKPVSGRRTGTAAENVLYNSESVKACSVFKYLGLPFHEHKWLSMAPQFMADKASHAMWALLKKIQGLRSTCMSVKVKLFMSLVASIGNYGSQIWGVEFLRIDSEAYILNNPFPYARALAYTGGQSEAVRAGYRGCTWPLCCGHL